MPDQKGSSIVPWPAIIAVFVALGGGAAFYFSALKSDRPDFAPGNKQSLGSEDVEARLWQDPFQAQTNSAKQLSNQSGSGEVAGQNALASADGSQTSMSGIEPAASDGDKNENPTPTAIKCLNILYPSPHSRELISKEIAAAAKLEIEAQSGNFTFVIPIMMQADMYPEIAERRLRTRVAVLEALGISGYKPVDTVHMGYFKLKWPSVRQDVSCATFPPNGWRTQQSIELVVPYEWCESGGVPMGATICAKKPPRRALVLWLNENVFYDLPIKRLGFFLREIIPSDTPADVHIIGPFVSTTLRAMVEEAETHKRPTTCQSQNAAASSPFGGLAKGTAIRVYSPTATASDAALTLGSSANAQTEEAQENISNLLSTAYTGADQSFKFERTTHTDWDICNELVAELYRRNVDLPTGDARAKQSIGISEYQGLCGDNAVNIARTQNRDCIALIGEWDTIYGRALPLTFAAAASGINLHELVEHPDTFPQWIKPFVYLRGIDGKISHATDDRAVDAEGFHGAEPAQSTKRENLKINGPDEQPEGMNQSDYLRRLADHISAWDFSLRTHGQRLAAVGVLGTDLYDKLLVLRAVRDKLPAGITYFTTDLDARYNLASEWSTSHNLVVCSSYGLLLNQFYQGNIPPFRDSLQTAVYAATLSAAGGAWPGGIDFDHVLDRPRVFEIGRTGAFDLSMSDPLHVDEWDRPRGDQGSLKPPAMQPQRVDLQPWWNSQREASGWGMLLGLTLLIAIPMRLGLRPKKLVFSHLLHSSRVFLILAIVAILFIIEGLSFWYGSEAPFAWAEGISIWPTEAIRLLVFLLCIHLFFKSKYEVNESGKYITKRFRFKATRAQQGFWTTFFLSYGKWKVFGNDGELSRHCSPDVAKNKKLAKVYAADVWREYRQRADYRMRALRFFPMAVAYFFIAYCLMAISGNAESPVRGREVAAWDHLITMLSVFSAISLTFYAIDATLLNAKIIRVVVQSDTHWPERAQSQFRRNHINAVELTEYLDINFIALRTEVVGKMVYYPLVVFFLIIVSRISLFDNWAWPTWLIIIMGVNVTLAIAPAYHLRSAAEDARELALRKIRERKVAALIEGSEARGAAFEQLAKEVENERRGAFSILSQYPLIAAILLPSGGIGLWVILEQLAQNFAGSQ